MSLAKAFFDVGLFTNQRELQQQFWSEQVGLTFDHTLKLGGGVLQHRYNAGIAVLKLNDARDSLPAPGTGPIVELLVATAGASAPRALTDPDGNRVTLVPPGHDGIQGLAVRLRVTDPARSRAFYEQVLGCVPEPNGALRCGEALLLLEQGDSAAAAGDAPLAAVGLRYLTLQVFDCDAAYASALACGAEGAKAPVTLGSTARIAFIRDPDGVWIELSERASVTGKAVSE
ncbi:VOC family protein [Halopseudomonas maritima]|uniref:VOC family protein n=1 Tax=Halopseudomonas maritima TaxID=2918528 RepID=UPI001EEB275F|nr:VOC family protein [Halopseudomonas maritima]UJJ31657.1 hypothetical protein HV822_00255 [Halopseudomonas maritima]